MWPDEMLEKLPRDGPLVLREVGRVGGCMRMREVELCVIGCYCLRVVDVVACMLRSEEGGDLVGSVCGNGVTPEGMAGGV